MGPAAPPPLAGRPTAQIAPGVHEALLTVPSPEKDQPRHAPTNRPLASSRRLPELALLLLLLLLLRALAASVPRGGKLLRRSARKFQGRRKATLARA